MSNGKPGVGIPVNVGGSTPVNTAGYGGPVNIPKNMNNANMTPTMANAHMNNANNNMSNNNINNSNSNNNNVGNANGNGHHASPVEIQQRQRILMQQRALQQQQAMQNFENQFFQLLMTLNKKPKRLYNFVEDTDSILQKYEQYRPSFEFHIYENNYKICAPANSRLQQQNNGANKSNNLMNNDGLILNKNNETLKEFLEYVARGLIPEAIMEVLRDSNIQFYESNLILQVYDHTNTVEVTVNKTADKNDQASNTTNTNTAATNNSQAASPNNKQTGPNAKQAEPNRTTENKPPTIEPPKTFRRPRVYRTLLRPNDLTNYYDMMTYADQARFSDSIYQQFESEILTLTKRNVQLDVQLNPYENRDKIAEDEFVEPIYNEETQSMEFIHREESTADGTKGKVGHIAEHEELPQNTSNYEQLMLIMNERTTTTTNSTFATALAQYSMNLNNGGDTGGSISSRNSSISLNSVSGSSLGGNKFNNQSSNIPNAAAAAAAAVAVGSNNENNQFNRLKFIEQWKVNKEKRKQQMALNNTGNGLSNGSSVPGTPFNTKISMTVPMTPQKQFLQQQQQLMQANEKKNSKGSKRGAANADKPKTKRPRKNKKTADGTQQTPKRKRVPKKKAATATNSNSTAGSPSTQSPSSMNTPF